MYIDNKNSTFTDEISILLKVTENSLITISFLIAYNLDITDKKRKARNRRPEAQASRKYI